MVDLYLIHRGIKGRKCSMAKYPSYLIHHGIPGQKWGVRNGPPYPLLESTKSTSEKKNELVLSNNAKVDKIAYEIGKSFVEKSLDKMTEAVVGGVLGRAAKTISELANSAKNVNPTTNQTNCGSCASAILYNMSNVGDKKVIALDSVPKHMRRGNGYDPEKLIDCFETGEWDSVYGNNRKEIHDTIKDKALQCGEGSKGIFYTDKRAGGLPGHYYVWTIMDGKFTVVEGQAKAAKADGIVWNKENEVFDNVFRTFDPTAEMAFARLDTDGVVRIKPDRERDVIKKN